MVYFYQTKAGVLKSHELVESPEVLVQAVVEEQATHSLYFLCVGRMVAKLL